MDDLRLCTVGLGNRGVLAREAHRPHAGSTVVAAIDTAPERLERATNWFGDDIFTTTDHRHVLDKNLDAAIILAPDHTHEQLAIDFLSAGVAVFVEKPLAITIEGCDRILRAARDHGARLFVGHNMRHMAMVLKLRQLINDGAIGEVKTVWCRHFVGHGGDYYFKDWHAERRFTNSLLLQKAAHDIDIIHWLANGYTERVTAMGGLTVYGQLAHNQGQLNRPAPSELTDAWPPASQVGLNPATDVEDLEMVLMALDNGVYAAYQQCQYTPDYWRNYTVIGTEGRIENFGVTENAEVRLWNRRSDFNPDADHVFPVPPTDGLHGGADKLIMAEFLRFVRDGGATNTSPVAARQSVATGVQAAASLRRGSAPLDVPPLDDTLIRYFASGQPIASSARS